MIQLENMQVFLCVARTGSLSAAANELGVNQTTVYRRLRAYERDLGLRVFERGDQGHNLTEAGKDVFATAERVESEMLDLRRRLASKSNDFTGSIRVSTTQILADRMLIPALSGFNHVYPDITVGIHTTRTRVDLTKREADVAIRSALNPPDNLVAHSLVEHDWMICASEQYIALNGSPSSLEEFDQHKFLLGTGKLGEFQHMQWMRDKVPDKHVAMNCNSVSSLVSAVGLGFGIGLLPRYLVNGPVQAINIEIPRMLTNVYLIFHPDSADDKRIRAFSDYVREAVETQTLLASR